MLRPEPVFKFWISPDKRFVMLAMRPQKLFRHSFIAMYDVYEVREFDFPGKKQRRRTFKIGWIDSCVTGCYRQTHPTPAVRVASGTPGFRWWWSPERTPKAPGWSGRQEAPASPLDVRHLVSNWTLPGIRFCQQHLLQGHAHFTGLPRHHLWYIKCCIQFIKKLTSYSQPSKKEHNKDAAISVPQKYFSIGEGSSDTGWFDGKLRIYNSVLVCISYVLKLHTAM